MKKVILIVVMFVIATFFIIEDKNNINSYVNNNINDNNVKAIYFSYIELEKYIKDKPIDTIKENINTIINNISSSGFNLLILHVRPFSDSIYPSNIFLPSKSVTSGNTLSFDILKYFLEVSHSYNISVHAWINPYRISSDNNYVITSNHPAYSFVGTNHIKVLDNGVYYNPASEKVNSLIVSGIEEIVTNYDVDGIHFDDYFYPSDDIDLENYNEYKALGGKLSIEEYRYKNISKMLSLVYSSIKKIDDSVLFGIAPQGNIENNYSMEYLDIKSILSSNGYIDYVMPQIYFGFNNSSKPFSNTYDEWSGLIKVDSIRLIPALALYKSGSSDKYAGSGINEWIDNSDILKRQILYMKSKSSYSGFSIFRYEHFYNSSNDNMKKEVYNIKEILLRK